MSLLSCIAKQVNGMKLSLINYTPDSDRLSFNVNPIINFKTYARINIKNEWDGSVMTYSSSSGILGKVDPPISSTGFNPLYS
jgi:hypothetical protein